MDGAYEEVIIDETGYNFTVEVHGVEGTGCAALQEKYEAFGTRTSSDKKPEFYQSPAGVNNRVSAR